MSVRRYCTTGGGRALVPDNVGPPLLEAGICLIRSQPLAAVRRRAPARSRWMPFMARLRSWCRLPGAGPSTSASFCWRFSSERCQRSMGEVFIGAILCLRTQAKSRRWSVAGRRTEINTGVKLVAPRGTAWVWPRSDSRERVGASGPRGLTDRLLPSFTRHLLLPGSARLHGQARTCGSIRTPPRQSFGTARRIRLRNPLGADP